MEQARERELTEDEHLAWVKNPENRARACRGFLCRKEKARRFREVFTSEDQPCEEPCACGEAFDKWQEEKRELERQKAKEEESEDLEADESRAEESDPATASETEPKNIP